jgi:hypothetical protein
VREELERINDLHLWDFEATRPAADTLLILGSNDFVYYHYLEAELTGVTFCDLPKTFSHARFRLGERYGDIWSIWVTAEANDTAATEFKIRLPPSKSASARSTTTTARTYCRANESPAVNRAGERRPWKLTRPAAH